MLLYPPEHHQASDKQEIRSDTSKRNPRVLGPVAVEVKQHVRRTYPRDM